MCTSRKTQHRETRSRTHRHIFFLFVLIYLGLDILIRWYGVCGSLRVIIELRVIYFISSVLLGV